MSEKTAMNEKKKKVLAMLKDAPDLYVLISAFTRMPYVFCDPETYDDEVFLFFQEADARREAEVLVKEGNLVQIARIEKEQRLGFYTSLYPMGINCLVADRGGAAELAVQLEDLVRRVEEDKLSKGQDRIENPQMHLTALYFMQELRRSKRKELTDEMKELNEEMMAHFQRGRYIIAVQEDKGIAAMKQKDGRIFQPVFTDISEFVKFNRDKKFRPVAVDSVKIPDLLAKETIGVAVNPMGVNILLNIAKKE